MTGVLVATLETLVCVPGCLLETLVCVPGCLGIWVSVSECVGEDRICISCS